MKWNDIRDRLKKSTNTVMESLQSPTPIHADIGISDPMLSTRKTLAKKVLFPLIVVIVIVTAVLAVYYVFKNKAVPADDTIKLDRAEVSAVNSFFTENPATPVDTADMQQVQNILNPQPVTPVATPPAAQPAVKK